MIKSNVSLKEYSRYKIGGPAKYFLEIRSEAELIEGLKKWCNLSANFDSKEKEIFILGGGTNLLISDNGFPGLIIHDNIHFISTKNNGVVLSGGLPFFEAVDYFASHAISGLAWAGGLPGTVGGAIRGNAGAFGGEIKDIIIDVESINLNTLKKIRRSNSECHFNYRTSIFKNGRGEREMILAATLRAVPGDKELIANEVQSRIDYRQARQPLNYPSIGSTFKNIPCTAAPPELVEECKEKIKNDPFPIIPVAYLLSQAGLRGKRIGGAQISEVHPNFIVNLGGASAGDVKALINLAQETIQEKFHVHIEPEIKYLGD